VSGTEFGPPMEAEDPIGGGVITLQTDRSLDEWDAVLRIFGTSEDGNPFFGPVFYAELTAWEAKTILSWLPDTEEFEGVRNRLRRLIAHVERGG
jgi:hypothetical protein